MERLHRMKEKLMDCIVNQVENNLEQVDTKELGEAIDMIKDLSKAIYYCTITDAMNQEHEDHKKQREYYPNAWEVYPIHPESEGYYDAGLVKYKKNYMESKALHHDKTKLMQELESYMDELYKDVLEMLQDMSMEEKQVLQQKLQHLMSKVK
jgi:vacuolar-type H+-ATPase subunit E/Vma4